MGSRPVLPCLAQPAHQPDEGHLEVDWVGLDEKAGALLQSLSDQQPSRTSREQLGVVLVILFF